MRTPYDTWLAYLLVVERMSEVEVQSVLSAVELPCPLLTELHDLRARVREGKPRRRSDEYMGWLSANKFVQLYTGTPGQIEARRIMYDPSARRMAMHLLTTGADHESVAHYLTTLLNMKAKPAGVQQFAETYWDVGSLTQRQWSAFATECYDAELLTRAAVQRNPEFALWQLGYRVMPSREDVLKTMFHESTMRFMETTHFKNSQGTAMSAKMWSEIAFGADDRLSETGSEAQRLLDELTSVRIKLGRRNISSIDAIVAKQDEEKNRARKKVKVGDGDED